MGSKGASLTPLPEFQARRNQIQLPFRELALFRIQVNKNITIFFSES